MPELLNIKNFRITIPDGYARKPLPFFAEWIEALSSGLYKQGHCSLYKRSEIFGESYCCLGVLSAVQHRLDKFALLDGAFRDDGTTLGSLAADNPCFSQLNRYGRFPSEILVENLQVPSGGRAISLANLNDLGLTFKEISDVIKKVWTHEG